MKIDRLLGLLSILANTDRMTIQELAHRFEVSKRTIFRDLDTLSRAGIPIVSYPGIGGGVAIIEGYKVDKNVLSTDDAKKIFTALNALKSIDGDTSVLNLIAKLVPENETTIFSQSDFVIDLSSWFRDSVIHEKIYKLRRAICECHCVCLEYVSRNLRSVRTIEPHKLVFKQSSWYIYAFCRESNTFRLFKISRIIYCDILDEQFQLRPIETIKFDDSYGTELFSPQKKKELFEVILEYDISDEFDLTDKIDASFFRRNNEGEAAYGQIRFQVSDLSWAADLVFTLVNKIRVISPPALKEEIKCRLNKINSYYKGDI